MRIKNIISLFMLFSLTACGNSNSTSSSQVDSTNTSEGTSSSSLVSSNSTSSSSKVSTSSSSVSCSISSSTTTSSTISSTSSSTSSSSSSVFVDLEKENILKAMEEGASNNSKVISGSLYFKTTKEVTTTYEFGNDQYGQFAYYALEDSEEYYGYNASKELYGLKIERKKPSKINIDQNELLVNGPEVKPYSETLYGAEGYMKYMYNIIVENKNYDYQSLTLENGYKFSVGVATTVGTKNYVWVNTVEFTLEEGAFKTIKATLDKYSDVGLNYATDTYYINPGAKIVSTYKVEFEQVIGERTKENPHDIETYYYDSFDLVDDSGTTLGDSVSILAGENYDYTISNPLPSTANIAVDPISLKVIEGEDNVRGSYSTSTKKFTIKCATPGEYKIEINTHDVSKVVAVTVLDPVAESIYVTSYILTGGIYNPSLHTEDEDVVDLYVGSEIYFLATIEPALASQEYEIEEVGDNKKLSIQKTTINTSSAGSKIKEVYEVISNEVGEYTLKFTSIENRDASITVKINVQEAPNFDDLISNKYIQFTAGQMLLEVEFTPSEENIKEGTVYINDTYGEENTYNYLYDEVTRDFNLTINGETANVNLLFDSIYKLILHRKATDSKISLTVFSVKALLINAEWQGTIVANEFFIFTFNSSSNTGKFNYVRNENFQQVDGYSCSFEYSTEECENGYKIILTNESIEKIKGCSRIDDVISLTLLKSYRVIESVMVISGEETVMGHNRVRS